MAPPEFLSHPHFRLHTEAWESLVTPGDEALRVLITTSNLKLDAAKYWRRHAETVTQRARPGSALLSALAALIEVHNPHGSDALSTTDTAELIACFPDSADAAFFATVMHLTWNELGSTVASVILQSGHALTMLGPLSRSRESIVRVSEDVGAGLLARYKQDPLGMRTMDRRLFEELIAELWHSFGYDVELTRQSADGGVDVVAVKHAEVKSRYLIQCKRPELHNKIEVAPVRELLGIVADQRATKGIIATTTHFTKGAELFLRKNEWQLEGRDFDGLCDWLGVSLTATDGAR